MSPRADILMMVGREETRSTPRIRTPPLPRLTLPASALTLPLAIDIISTSSIHQSTQHIDFSLKIESNISATTGDQSIV